MQHYELIGDIIPSSEQIRAELEHEKVKQVEVEMQVWDLAKEADRTMDTFYKYTEIGDNVDYFMESDSDNEHVFKAIGIALDFENITEGVMDVIKKGAKAVIDFVRKIIQAIKKFVYKIIDFVFRTSLGAKYQKSLSKAKPVLEDKDEDVVEDTVVKTAMGIFKDAGVTDIPEEEFVSGVKENGSDFKGLRKTVNDLCKKHKVPSDKIKKIVNALKGGVSAHSEDESAKKETVNVIGDWLKSKGNDAKRWWETHKEISDATSKLNKIKEGSKLSQADMLKLATSNYSFFEPANKIESNVKFIKMTVDYNGLRYTYMAKDKTGKPIIKIGKRGMNPKLNAEELSGAYDTILEMFNELREPKTISDYFMDSDINPSKLKEIKTMIDDLGGLDKAIKTIAETAATDDGDSDEIDALVQYYKSDVVTTSKFLQVLATEQAKGIKRNTKILNTITGKKAGLLNAKAKAVTLSKGPAAGKAIVVQSVKSAVDGANGKVMFQSLVVKSGDYNYVVIGGVVYRMDGNKLIREASDRGGLFGMPLVYKDAKDMSKENLESVKNSPESITLTKHKDAEREVRIGGSISKMLFETFEMETKSKASDITVLTTSGKLA